MQIGRLRLFRSNATYESSCHLRSSTIRATLSARLALFSRIASRSIRASTAASLPVVIRRVLINFHRIRIIIRSSIVAATSTHQLGNLLFYVYLLAGEKQVDYLAELLVALREPARRAVLVLRF